MKLKIMGYNEETMLTVSGEVQELLIHKENGCVILEFLEERSAINAEEHSETTVEEEIHLPTVPVLERTVPTSERSAEEDAVGAYYRNNTLFHKLSDLRRHLASEANVPTYMIFHDKTLLGMVEKMPKDLQSLGKISGVGKSKLEKYGSLFLDALKEGA